MKRSLLSAKELADELGVHEDTVRRAYWKKTIPGEQICKVLRFDLDKVRQGMSMNARAQQSGLVTRRATGGNRRRRADRPSPRSVKRGRNFQTARMRKRRRT